MALVVVAQTRKDAHAGDGFGIEQLHVDLEKLLVALLLRRRTMLMLVSFQRLAERS